ncbi:MAG: twin-arginine translocase subunit TatB [Sulfuricella sp.]|nr:twin-arginine translocase subunit TatB [Sulfuricella sp.]
MFDVSFTELLVIAIVTLIVVGPERLPKVARTVGLLFGRAQRYVSEVKSDINRELKLEELRKIEADMRQSAQHMEHTMTDEINSASQQFKEAAEAAQPALPAAETAPQAVPPASPQLELGLDSSPKLDKPA